MMPRVPQGYKSYTLAIRPEVYERLSNLAATLGRPVGAELEHAITRHCDQPPTLEAPPLEPAAASDQPARPARGRKPAPVPEKPSPAPKGGPSRVVAELLQKQKKPAEYNSAATQPRPAAPPGGPSPVVAQLLEKQKRAKEFSATAIESQSPPAPAPSAAYLAAALRQKEAKDRPPPPDGRV